MIRLSWIEARPVVQLVIALRLLVGGTLASTTMPLDAIQVTAAGIAWMLASWFVYLLNGLSDVEGDRLNGSPRPLASGRLTVRSGRVVCICLAGLAVGVSSTSGLLPLALTCAYVTLGAAYSIGPRPAKNHAVAASATVGLAGVGTYVFGSLAAVHRVDPHVVIAAVVLATWMFVAGNAKDFGDEKGDHRAGRATLPLLLGVEKTRRVLAGAVLIVGLGATAVGAIHSELLPLSLLLPAACLMVFMWLSSRGKRAGPKSGYQVFMWGQYAANAGLLVAGVSAINF